MLQKQIHSVQRHSIHKHGMFKVVGRQDTEQLLRSANSESRHQNSPATLDDLGNLLDKLFLKPISNRMILHRVRSLHYYRVQVLVFWVSSVDEPSRLTVEIPGVKQSLPVTLHNRLSATRNVSSVYQSQRAVANIGRLLILKITLMLQHSLEINVLVRSIVAAQLQEILDD